MASPTAVNLTPSARPNGLLSVLRRFPANTQWQRGVDVLVGSVLSPDRVGPCPVGSGEPDSPGSVDRFLPVEIRQGVFCSALYGGAQRTVQYAEESAGVTFAFALSSELVTGSATSNPSLSDATSLGTHTTAVAAICAIEAGLEPRLSGRQGVIHVPVGHACDLGNTVYRSTYEGREVWRTYAGNLVAIHGTGSVVYGTGEIWGDWELAGTQDYVDRATNTAEAWANVLAIAVFDPDVNISVNISGS